MNFKGLLLTIFISHRPSAFGFLFLLVSYSFPILGQSIKEEKFVSIGGIQQWLTISGVDRSNPVVLFLHGGPGSPGSLYSEAIFEGWEKEFVLVNWDQRGAGRTFGKNAPTNVDEEYWIENPLTVERMTADGIEVAEYLLKNLGNEKIILMGTSWGSVLGSKMALSRPDLFYAYVGHSQLVNPAGDIRLVYRNLLSKALELENMESKEILQTLGPPPYDDARNTGRLMRLIKKYESENAVPAPESWWKPAPQYDNPTDAQHREDGDDYSFIHYAGHAQLSIEAMSASINLLENGLVYEIPVFLIQGNKDILTPLEISKAYFDKITAPKKGYFTVSGAAHGFNQPVVDMLYSILHSQVLPEIR